MDSVTFFLALIVAAIFGVWYWRHRVGVNSRLDQVRAQADRDMARANALRAKDLAKVQAVVLNAKVELKSL